MAGTDFLPEFLGLLKRARIRYAVIDGQAVNAYVEPLACKTVPGTVFYPR